MRHTTPGQFKLFVKPKIIVFSHAVTVAWSPDGAI
jgi:hypothetical protein